MPPAPIVTRLLGAVEALRCFYEHIEVVQGFVYACVYTEDLPVA